MQRKRRKKKRFGVFLFLLVVCIGIGIMFVPWAMQPENFREVKNKINGFLYKEDFPDSYNAKSLIWWIVLMMKYLFQKRERATNSCKFSQAVCY